jgi:FkbM family methyltransferase
MGIKKRALNLLAKAFVNASRLNRVSALSCEVAELIDPLMRVERKGECYVFSCPNSLTKWRVDTFFTKEPETIEWIDGFEKQEVMFDIGGNIGLYSIYAAKRGIRVISFEPESQNYALLNKNVFLNKCGDNVMCLNSALADKDSLGYLYTPAFRTGGAINCFGGTKDWNNTEFSPDFKQGVLSYSLDSFIERHPGYFPSRIKIDVDGIEPKIIRGAVKALGDRRLKSILIEINESLKEHLDIIQTIKSYGFSLLHKKHAPMLDSGPYDKCFNYVFVRQ